MREILFRGKRSDNGEWVKGFLHKNKGAFFLYIDQIEFINEDIVCNTYKVGYETIGQFTGLQDKNGVKIFEGDILKDKKYILLVKWDDSLCSYVTYEGKINHITNLSYYCKVRDLEVIGNIHDNPELLEGLK